MARPVSEMSLAEARAALNASRDEVARLKKDQRALVGTINTLARSEVLADRLAEAIRRHTVVPTGDEDDSVAEERWRAIQRHVAALLEPGANAKYSDMLSELHHLCAAIGEFGNAWANDADALRKAAEAYFGGDFQAPLEATAYDEIDASHAAAEARVRKALG